MAIGSVGGVAVGGAGGKAGGVDRENTRRGRAGDVGHTGATELRITVGRSDRIDDADGGEARVTGRSDVATERRTRVTDARARGTGNSRRRSHNRCSLSGEGDATGEHADGVGAAIRGDEVESAIAVHIA